MGEKQRCEVFPLDLALGRETFQQLWWAGVELIYLYNTLYWLLRSTIEYN